MHSAPQAETSKLALIADVGHNAMRLGLTDGDGRLRRETIRTFESHEQSSISGAFSSFSRSCALEELPRRCAIAISGAAVGDTISVPNSRWFLSRSGLTAMLQAPPLILNDFAANAWALSAPDSDARIEAMAGAPFSAEEPGTRCLIGVGSGLGIAVIVRDEQGRINVLPTEGGHCHFMAGLAELDPLLDGWRAKEPVTAEDLLSTRGLLALYRMVVGSEGATARASDTEGVMHLVTHHDPHASRAAALFARALWYFAGNMALAYGAWNGVMITGSLARALRSEIRSPDAARYFVVPSPWQRQLREVPRVIVSLEHAELRGAAQALLIH
ncbi:glucokinase [Sphingomonas sp. OTU376]|uniref:glucokinase n=1 Tax=Sphingomonas sp. OTU376 TaxID=3043863 RepID=UPI00313E1CE1